jgi:succinate dehydrogenase / fumarate reductase iron-sulfur subunit
VVMFQLTIKRYDPERKDPTFEDTFDIPAGSGEKVTYGLEYIYKHLDPTLSYLIACRTSHCGLCAMTINGRPRLACMESLTERTRIQALKNLPVVKDLVIDREAVFRHLGERLGALAFLSGKQAFDTYTTSPPLSSLEDALEKTNCILCLCCLAACPVSRKNGQDLLLPLEFIFLDILNLTETIDRDKARAVFEQMGLLDCTDCKQCQMVCPREIRIYDRIIKPMIESVSG